MTIKVWNPDGTPWGEIDGQYVKRWKKHDAYFKISPLRIMTADPVGLEAMDTQWVIEDFPLITLRAEERREGTRVIVVEARGLRDDASYHGVCRYGGR